MALRPTAKDHQVKNRLVEAAAVLREHQRPDLADAVDYVLSPKGWPMLGRLRSAAGGSDLPKNLPISMQRPVKEHIKRAAAAKGDDLTTVVEEGLRAFINGDFRPGRPPRAEYGTSDRVNLNLRPDGELVQQAKAMCEDKALPEEWLGWRPSVSVVARLWLLERYPLPQSADTGAEQ